MCYYPRFLESAMKIVMLKPKSPPKPTKQNKNIYRHGNSNTKVLKILKMTELQKKER